VANRPGAEIDVTHSLVRDLVTGQFPELAKLPLTELSKGWDNTNLRLGDDHIVRVPHRQAAAPLILHEQRWLPELSSRFDLPIPAPTHCGESTQDYPWHWSITPWFEGAEAAGAELGDPAETANLLGGFFSQLHQTAPTNAPPNPYRGGPLSGQADKFESRVNLLDTSVDQAAVRSLFAAACTAPVATDHVWLHGDLHARNMIVNDGRLSAIIDWGDICSGDRATDLAGAFMLVPAEISTVRELAGASDADWERARGWAIYFAVMYLTMSDDDPVMMAIGERLLDTLLTN